MSWQKVLLLLGVVALLHVVIIFGVVDHGKDGGENSAGAEPVLDDSIFNRLFRSTSPDGEVPPLSSPDEVKPWDYGSTEELPADLKAKARKARGGIIIVDLESRRVLWEKDSRKPVAIASLTKLMSLLVIAEKMESDPSLKNAVIEISSEAAKVENAKLIKGKYPAKDLLYSMIVGSFNDAATQLAISSHGSFDNFVKEMNKRAEKMGLKNAKFNSPSGLPQNGVNSFASVSEVLHLCETVMKYPELKKICGTPKYKLSKGGKRKGGNEIGSDNLLINGFNVPGAFGFKTGYTDEAGRCLAFGVERNGRTIIGCITGFGDKSELAGFARDLVNWAFKTKRSE